MEYSDVYPHVIHNSGDKYLISIIIPVYNVEKYIRPCLESVFRQNLEESIFEVIIVNDGTQDRSMEIIQDIINQHPNISVINQENLSLSVARNNGMAKAKGEYILMPDSDDLLIDNSLSLLLKEAVKSKADLVVADFLEMTDEEIEKNSAIPQKEWRVEEKSGERLFLEDLNPRQCYVWRTLFRREFLLENHLRFVPGIRYQDVPFTHECYLKAKKCLRISWLLNIYRRGHESATFSFDIKKARDFCIAMAETWKLIKKGNNPLVLKKLKDDIFVSFVTLISWISFSFKEDSVRMDILHYLEKQIPDLRFYNGFHQMITTMLYRTNPHLFMNLHFYGRCFKQKFKYLFK